MPKENANPDVVLEAIKKIDIVSELVEEKNKCGVRRQSEAPTALWILDTRRP